MNTKPEKKPGPARRKYDEEFKRQALQMVRDGRADAHPLRNFSWDSNPAEVALHYVARPNNLLINRA